MTRGRPRTTSFLAGAAGALIVLAAAGCGDDDDAASAPPKNVAGHAAVVDAADAGNLGTILVDARGHTLYLFNKDSGTQSACTGACAAAWPPLRASGAPTVDGALTVSMAGVTRRSDGKPQVTYNGHPLYRFTGDKMPGDTNGEGLTAFGGGWFALSAAGNQVSGTGSPSGNGY